MLTLVGLGLRDGDLSERAQQAIADADVAYAELYTNAISYDLAAITAVTGTDITVLERSAVEEDDQVFAAAHDHDVVFLVSGDPLTATTHQELLFRAADADIETEVIHAPSILTAVAETGVSIYKFGRTTTLPAPYNDIVPDSPFEVTEQNRANGLHTLMLLDIGMSAAEAMEIITERLDGPFIVCSELGTKDRHIAYGNPDTIDLDDFGVPCCVIIPGEVSDNEAARLKRFQE